MLQIDLRELDGLIFDCDGTLSDSMPVHYIAWRDTMAAHGIEFTEERFYQMGGMPSVRIVRQLAGEQSVALDPIAVANEKESAFASLLDRVEPFHAVCEIARRYHGQVPMAVASGSDREIVMKQLVALDLVALFDAVVTSEDTERHKPEPDVFLEAARRIQIDPDRCLVFEDSPLGIQAAQAAGMRWVDVRTLSS